MLASGIGISESKEIQIVYRLFLVLSYLLQEPLEESKKLSEDL